MLDGLGKMSPEILEILDRAKAGTITEEAAMEEMLAFMFANPELAKDFEALANTVTAPLRDAPIATIEPQWFDKIEEAFTGGVPIWEDRSAEGKLARFNPLYEAAVTERLQFDGDIPELRTGPLPEGADPAVPIDTQARNPTAIGLMLEQASTEVAEEIQALLPEHLQQTEQFLEAKSKCLDLTEQHVALPPVPQPKGYEPGELPALRSVDEPSGSQLAKISQERRQELVWKALTTTQGRRSILPMLKAVVEEKLLEAGQPMVATDERVFKGDVVAHHEWSMDISGPKAGQPDFSFVDVAIQAFSTSLLQQLGEPDWGHMELVLDIIPINTVNVRRVGWGARVKTAPESDE